MKQTRDNFRRQLTYSWLIALRKISPKQMVLILSCIVGILSGLAAVVLKNTIHFTHSIVRGFIDSDTSSILLFALPGIGILLTILFVKYVVKDNISHGVTRILHSISRRESKLKSHNTYSSIVSSSLTIGFGGSVGAEAPIVLTGAAIGSNIGQLFRQNYKTITLLLGCGAAAAIASIFKAPLAGVVFTLEVLMLDLTMSSIVPLLIAAVVATSISYFLIGRDVVFAYEFLEPFELSKIPYFVLLGIFCGLLAFYFTRTAMRVESKFASIQNTYTKWLVGAISLGLLIFLFPPLYGEGYGTLQALLDQTPSELFNNTLLAPFHNNVWILLLLLALILVFKVFAMAITTGSGGIGGTFAPTLFMGGIAGYFMSKLINTSFNTNLHEGNFALVGMGGMMAAVMHAPLTAIFLIAELTSGYTLFVPLMITSTTAYITIMGFEPHSIYTKRLAAKGHLITHHKDKAVLTLLKLRRVVENDFTTVQPDASLRELVDAVSRSKRNIYPVVSKERKLLGVVLLDDIREIMFDHSQYDTITVSELMSLPPAYINTNEPMESVMEKFESTGAWNLPVVEDEQYKGFVSKSKIFSAYRSMLMQFTDE